MRTLAVTPAIEQQFLTVISEHTADCLQQRLRWTNLKQQEIADAMSELADGDVNRYLVRQLLKQHGFVKRQALKKKSFRQHSDRNTQFERIIERKAGSQAADEVVLSVNAKHSVNNKHSGDTNKKDVLGRFYRDGNAVLAGYDRVCQCWHHSLVA